MDQASHGKPRSIIPQAVREARAAAPGPRAQARASRREIIAQMLAKVRIVKSGRREGTSPCPNCGKGIPDESIVVGENVCPHCRSTYNAGE